MSGPNFSYINQFKRNGHAPLPKSQPENETEWISNGPYIGYPNNGIDSIAGVEMVVHKASNVGKSSPIDFSDMTEFFTKYWQLSTLADMIRKYPRPPASPSRFMEKATIPRGIGETTPYGNPSIRYSGHLVFGGMIVRPTEREFLEKWIDSFVRIS
ncbi:hypothetical protein [Ralstonia phage RSF1]|uniref:Uncharacterized protein n=1 Tax=Ralstonia phage RSF1 TaxID=1689679 RepID=A0A0K2QQZ6_9CAUD|nr:hypothetical protein AVU11_gp222 [Ralstonia phage RSF1]BAS05014.1 hypothetical protein [Ralstonia phage RSF1]